MKYYTTYASPIGTLHLVSEKGHLTGLYFKNPFPNSRNTLSKLVSRDADSILKKTCQQLADYFSGRLQDFDLPLKMDGTEFQKKAWLGLKKIPYGETRSYAQQAQSIGHPQAVRAVGTANGRNPISIIVPCHRVIRGDQTLGGYGGGLPIKEFLLNLETTSRKNEQKDFEVGARR